MYKENYFSVCDKSDILNFLQNISAKRKNIFDIQNSALLILDMQNYFIKSESHAYIPAALSVIPHIQKLKAVFELNERPVIASRHVNTADNHNMMGKWWKGFLSEGTDAQIIPEFSAVKSFVKSQYDAFYETALEDMLHEKRVISLVITGVMTHLCCDTTARSAFVRGFEVYIPYNAVATYNQLIHDSSLRCLAHGCAHIVKSEEIYEK